MFRKLTAIEPVSLVPAAEKELYSLASEVVLYDDIPSDNDEIVRRIGDADAVLLSYTSRMDRDVIARCPNLRYIGMCCSLYSEESANVDIAFAREKGICVKGIRDYGDRGVVEYVLHELTGLLHGFDLPRLHDEAEEIYGLPVGMVGFGTSGRMIAEALRFLGADIRYYCRAPKPDAEAAGMHFTPRPELLQKSQVVITCLNKNVLLLGEAEFAALADRLFAALPAGRDGARPVCGRTRQQEFVLVFRTAGKRIQQQARRPPFHALAAMLCSSQTPAGAPAMRVPGSASRDGMGPECASIFTIKFFSHSLCCKSM